MNSDLIPPPTEDLAIIREGDFAPADLHAEMALIGWAIRHPVAIAFMQKVVKPEDFYGEAHRAIVERIYAKYEADKPVTSLTLALALKANFVVMEWADGQKNIEPTLHEYALTAPATVSDQDLERQVVSIARTVADLRVRRWAIEGVCDVIARLRMGEEVSDALAPIVAVADEENQRGDQAQGSEVGYYAADELIRSLEHDDREGRLTCSTGLQGLR
jgi:replicative DNA helicase